MDFKYHLQTTLSLCRKFVVPFLLLTLLFLGAGVISLGILIPPMMAGYTQAFLLALRQNREPEIKDVFSRLDLFWSLTALFWLIIIVAVIGFSMLILPGVAVLLAVSYWGFYVLPLMVDKNLSILKAIKQSYQMVMRGDKTEHLVVVILYLGINIIGSSAFIGILLTTPLATAFMVSVYDERMPAAGAQPPEPIANT